ncbi:MAG: signal peptidase II [Bacteroidetes bacterium]|nr:signal peptidase II [Bacteroidota bacterium]
MLKWIIVLSVFGINLTIDQVSKSLARLHLEYLVSTSYFSDFLRIIYVENTGVALSFGSDWSPMVRFLLFNVLVLIILIVLIVYLIRTFHEQTTLKLIAFSLILSGGVGNLIDRFMREGAVTDFLNVGFGTFRTAIFNWADFCVTTGLLILLALSIIETIRLRRQENPA